ncbi:MAG: oxygen-independent coproporphyrinogen III oxidase-like protein [Burkholderiales bacterium]|nr:MAG: oxygen-independent coproporphyrinogen III oxidase-like protein [Burkholderiales bacterium]TAG79049.1 MAG: oxygen-independent coproporphyrinogen III oxidase-like protein [Betaproteobacteria bacterium]
MLSPQFTSLPPLSLYIHIPWCIRKCPYCDFNSHEGSVQEREYTNALMSDLESELPNFWGRTIHTVFFGGGTPSLFSADAIGEIIAGVRARTRLSPQAEITLEANPGTFESQKFANYKSIGINRLSIGIQSFNDAHLKALGRVHDSAEAKRAIEIGLSTIGNVNLDVMFALPASHTKGGPQTMAECEHDVETALSFNTPHLSFYQLTMEPNTVFAKKPPPLPDHDLAADMQMRVEAMLESAGYVHYETSGYAKPGRECQHNLNYWKFGDYVGIGAGAHGKLSMPGTPASAASIVRTERVKQPREYMQRALSGNAVHDRRIVMRSEVGFEFMLNALRLTDGFAIRDFEERTGFKMSLVSRALDECESRGLIERDHVRVKPTARGRQFLNTALERFL